MLVKPAVLVVVIAIGAALAAGSALAQTLTIKSLEGPHDAPMQLVVPSLDITGASATEAEIRAAFADPATRAGFFADFDAARIHLPSFTLSLSVPATETAAPPVMYTATYTDVALVGVEHGTAHSLSIGSINVDYGSLGGTLSVAEVRALNVNLAGVFGIDDAAGDTAALRPLSGPITIERGSLALEGVTCDLGQISIGATETRPVNAALDNLRALAPSTPDTPVDPAVFSTILDSVVDILTAYRGGEAELAGFTCTAPSGDEVAQVSAGPIHLDAFEPGVYPALSVGNLTITAPGTTASLDGLVWKRMDFRAAIAALRAAPRHDAPWLAANWRLLIPDISGMSLSGLAIDAPDPQDAAKRLAVSLGGFDLSLGAYRDGMPSTVSLLFDRLTMPITPDMTETPFPELRARGITELTVSLAGSAQWDRERHDLTLSGLTFDAGGFGRIVIDAAFGDATEALLSDNPAMAEAAALRLSLKSLTVALKDGGLAGILLAGSANEAGETPEAYRTGMSGLMQGMALAYLGNTDEALDVARAIGVFIAGASDLTLSATAKDPAGVLLADFATLEKDPSVVGTLFTVTADASGAAVALPPRVPVSADRPNEDGVSLEDQKLRLKSPAAPSP